MESGVVYILCNPAFPKLLKVGMTTGTADSRAKQLSRYTGVPKDYIVLWERKVPNITLAESVLHYFLHKYAYNKEFFQLPSELAIEICHEAINRVFAPLDFKKIKQNAKLASGLTKISIELDEELKRMKLTKAVREGTEIEKFNKEKTSGLSILPVGNTQTNWQSISDSLNYKFGKEAIRLILKERKKGDPLRKRFVSYRRRYYYTEAIHLFFTKNHILVYAITLNTDIKKALEKRYGKNFKRIEFKAIDKGYSFKIKNNEDFQVLKAMLHMGERAFLQYPLRKK